MDYEFEKLTRLYKQLENLSSKTLKTSLIAKFLLEIPKESIFETIRLLLGKIFAEWEEYDLGMGEKLVIRSISLASGISKEKLEKWYIKYGDLGIVAEEAIKNKKQISLLVKPLTVKYVYNKLRKIAFEEGEGSIDRKVRLLAELLISSKPIEAKYLVRIVLEELRIGVAEGIIRDSISKAYNIPTEIVEKAYFLTSDYAFVGEVASKYGIEGLKNIKIELGIRPIKVMLAQAAKDIYEAFNIVGSPAAIEYKYDGIRAQIHKIKDKVVIFSRRLNNITKQFPEVVNYVKKYVKSDYALIEGEIVAWDFEKNRPKPFQYISRRIQRKYDIHKMLKEIPVKVFIFDVVYHNTSLLDVSYEERHKILESIIEESENFKLANRIVTSSYEEANNFYKKALEEGHEGVMFKNLKVKYQPGKRVGYMVKLKPILDTIDCVIIKAEWGEGKRANWLTSFYIAVKDEDTGELLEIGKAGSGLTEEELEELTKRLLEIKIKEEGKIVYVKPKIVVEVAFQEIEKSPRYKSGYALRFPRVVRIRDDKSIEEIDTIERLKELYSLFEKNEKNRNPTSHS